MPSSARSPATGGSGERPPRCHRRDGHQGGTAPDPASRLGHRRPPLRHPRRRCAAGSAGLPEGPRCSSPGTPTGASACGRSSSRRSSRRDRPVGRCPRCRSARHHRRGRPARRTPRPLRARFEDGGCVIEQPFQPRVAEGHDPLLPRRRPGRRLRPPERRDPAHRSRARRTGVMGLPSPKTMFPADAPDFARLRASRRARVGAAHCEPCSTWPSRTCRSCGTPTSSSDPRTPSGEDTYVLCEINCSCVTPFPPDAPAHLARAVYERLADRRHAAAP